MVFVQALSQDIRAQLRTIALFPFQIAFKGNVIIKDFPEILALFMLNVVLTHVWITFAKVYQKDCLATRTKHNVQKDYTAMQLVFVFLKS
mmetsp:Transcript_17298/g.24041  ORF Transcript_17298/g.24041 Transcript_17298/m.24041 type:complete len:90 (+) Transcript_17298:210-479(+)